MVSKAQKPLWRKILKITLWTLMAAVLAVVALLICTFSILKPEQLTPLSSHVVNKMLDAKVEIGRVELSIKGKTPFLYVDIDDVSIISDAMLALPDSVRSTIPAYADTLLTIKHFGGGINPLALLVNKVDLRDVQFVEPQINIFTLNDSVSNYLIYAASEVPDTVASEETQMPAIAINRFSIDSPRPIRYDNALTDQHASLTLTAAELDGEGAPTYSLQLGGDLASPELQPFSLDDLRFGLDGNITWDPAAPSEIVVDDVNIAVDDFAMNMAASISMGEDIIVREYTAATEPIRLARVLQLVPDSMLRSYGFRANRINTNLEFSLAAQSTAPYNLTTDLIPQADISLVISPGHFKHRQMRFEKIKGEMQAQLRGDNLNNATFIVKGLLLQGPATDLTLDLVATRVMNDPKVRGKVVGHSNFDRLPETLTKMIPGTLTGYLTADLDFEGQPSMLSRQNFHRLRVNGDLDATNINYVDTDSAMRVYANHARFQFGSHNSFGEIDSLLTAGITVDSAYVSQDMIVAQLKGLKFGVESSNRQRSADTTMIIPIGGGIKLDRLRLTMLDDSTSLRVRELKGRVSLQRYSDNAHLPQLSFDVGARSILAGMPDARIVLNRPSIRAVAHKKPLPQLPKAVKDAADSLMRLYPDMSRDSVFAQAIRQYRLSQPMRRRGRRPYAELSQADMELVNWGASSEMRKFLLRWDFEGSIAARRARMFTTAFPIRSRINNFNLAFNNDSIVLDSVVCKAGSSDFLINGIISNMKRGFTDLRGRSPLRLKFDVTSDTIDVNELAATVFRSSAYTAATDSAELDDEFGSELKAMEANVGDSVGPLLVPHNVDMHFDMRAKNIRYSDLTFNDFDGEILVFGGAVNMRRLSAVSDIGDINISALYSAPRAKDMRFGFSMQMDDFIIDKFINLIPAVDSIMPILNDVSGIIDADIAATSDIDSEMNFVLPSLEAAVRLSGDSLQIIDRETFEAIGKWLMFKNKKDNVIKHMDIEFTVADNQLQVYPQVFDIDRYRLGIQGHNDLAMNFDYHVAVIKSPLPFKFGINIKGNTDDYKIRLGKARLNEKQVTHLAIVDTTRVNLLNEIENVFRRGVNNSRFRGVKVGKGRLSSPTAPVEGDTISRADSLVLIERGIIQLPQPVDTVDNKLLIKENEK